MLQKRLVLSVFVCSSLLGAWLLAWCYYSFFQYRTEIEQLLNELPLAEKDLPHDVKEIFVKGRLLENDYRWHDRLLYKCRGIQGMKKLEIKSHEITWHMLIPLTLNEQEQISLYAHLMPFEDGEGLNYGANHYFSKSVNELTIDEILTLVVIARSPSYYLPDERKAEIKEAVERWKINIALP